MNQHEHYPEQDDADIAVIGLTGRFPGAPDIEKFWQNIRDGVESIHRLSANELEAAGISSSVTENPNYVPVGATIEGAELFDAKFFDFTPKEAETMDPQHRIFLECTWEALEDAGYYAEGFDGAIGMYGGSLLSTYLLNLYSNQSLLNTVGIAQIGFGNNVDYLTTTVSYKLGLNGPSVAVQTACSTSLVAVHMACQALLSGECDMALAGGVAIRVPQNSGYEYQEGGILSPDGHCRPFDASAQGTVFGNGAGIVVLKRLQDAIEDGDCIRAIIKGTAINNDGSTKVGFTAPSVQGQASVVVEALASAGISAETIGYVEAHGTGTVLGDPIEIQALTEAFRMTTEAKGYCPVGSLKSNIGHLDAAAGIAGLIKTILSLEHKSIPPSLHFTQPNPKIDFVTSPFYVNTNLRDWESKIVPRRAGVSSLGIGGTNAHVIVEEAPESIKSGVSRDWQLLLLSAKSQNALNAMTDNLCAYLEKHPDISLADVSYTLQLGRKPFNFRRALVCNDVADAVAQLKNDNQEQGFTAATETAFRPLVFMFPGQASQYSGMAAQLYASESFFREQVEQCIEILRPHLDVDLISLVFCPHEDNNADLLQQTYIAQPALFVVEYALSRWLMHLGLKPSALIGHSVGEYVAACLAGVFTLEDGLCLIAARGRLMQEVDQGSMLSVQLSQTQAKAWLNETLSLAAVNSPRSCVISGPIQAISELEKGLRQQDIPCQRLRTSHAFHSAMMDPVLTSFQEVVSKIDLKTPNIPYLSNVTGTWASDEVTHPEYWLKHLRDCVKFSPGIVELQKDPKRLMLEVGPGQALCSLTNEHRTAEVKLDTVAFMRHANDQRTDSEYFFKSLAKVWLAGANINWKALYIDEHRHRLPLPPYPFQRERFWVNATPFTAQQKNKENAQVQKKVQLADWFYLPFWKPSLSQGKSTNHGLSTPSNWLILMDEPNGVGDGLARQLENAGNNCIRVFPQGSRATLEERDFQIDPSRETQWHAMLQKLLQSDCRPDYIVHLWTLEQSDTTAKKSATGLRTDLVDKGFYSLLNLAKTMAKANLFEPVKVWLISNQLYRVSGTEDILPEKSLSLGPCLVTPQEHSNIRCRSIDVVLPQPGTSEMKVLADTLFAELFATDNELAVAYRGNSRWLKAYEPVKVGDMSETPKPLRKGGVYLILGGLGRFGLIIAKHLASVYQAKLILTTREKLPPREVWEARIANADDSDKTAWRLNKLLELQELGAEVLVRNPDLSDAQQLSQTVKEIVTSFGELNGVIHAAGIQQHTSILSIEQSECDAFFSSKVSALYALEQALERCELDFCLLTSSLSPFLGGLGFVAYSAANLFLDAYAANAYCRGLPWRTINWESWHRIEQTTTTNDATGNEVGSEVAKLVMTDEEVVDCFTRALCITHTPQLVIATGDLKKRIEQWVKLQQLGDYQSDRPQNDEDEATVEQQAKRLDLVAPRDEIEQAIVEVGRAVLGIDEISIYDNFFDMGGSSLLAVQLMSRLRETFKQQIPLSALFEQPTVAGLAEVIREGDAKEEEIDEINALLEEIEALDEDEVERRLGKEN